jgi:tetratricopeptide (TPR) repeat protein
MKIFLSYRREDSAGHTGRLFDALQAHFGKDSVFLDRSGIDSGQNFVDVIQNAIRSSNVLIAIIGREWLTCRGATGRRLDDPNDLVRYEIVAALEQGIPVIPVLVDGATPPSPSALPDALKPLAHRDCHEISDERWAYDVSRLISATEKLTGKPRPQHRMLFAAIAVAAAIAVIGIPFYLRSQEPASRFQEAADVAARGTALLEAGDYERAIAEFDAALAVDPRPDSYYNRGLAYYSTQNLDKAIDDWNTVIRLQAGDARAYRQRGNAYFAKGDHGLAIADYDRAIELEPSDATAVYNRGLVRQARGQIAEAAEDFTRAIALGSKEDVTRAARARLNELTAPAARGTAASALPVQDTPAIRSTTSSATSVEGRWIAEVKYDWGATHTERFSFKVDGNELLGTAGFLGAPRGIVNGTVNGDRLTFEFTTQILGDSTNAKDVRHRYRGKVTGDTIAFYAQNDSPSNVPVEFTATRDVGAR